MSQSENNEDSEEDILIWQLFHSNSLDNFLISFSDTEWWLFPREGCTVFYSHLYAWDLAIWQYPFKEEFRNFTKPIYLFIYLLN